MICRKCGKLIGDSSAYCMFCHAPTLAGAHFDVELDVLGDEELFGLLKKEEMHPEGKPSVIKTEKESQNFLKDKKIIISLVTIVSCLAIAIFGYTYTQSYAYAVSRANKMYLNGDYEGSSRLFEKALSKNPEGIEALIGIGNCYSQLGDYSHAKEELTKALNIETDNTQAYSSLIDLYKKSEDSEGLKEVSELATTEEMLEILNTYIVSPPAFDIQPGKYKDDVVLNLTVPADVAIYYTLNGKDPTKGEGILYTEPIIIKEGKTMVRAAAYKNETFSSITEGTYDITYEKPALPKVNPMNGTFSEPTRITITTDVENASIYYTWDGSSPTTSSTKYTGPIEVIAGNNILSVIVVDKRGLQSEVLKCNYTYIVPVDESLSENPAGNLGDGKDLSEEETIENDKKGDS